MDPDSFTADAEISGLLKSLAETPHVRPFLGTERYRVVQCLGEGGFGVVYEVEDRRDGRRLALKMLRPRGTGVADAIRKLKGEFRSVADVVHPNLVALEELSCDHDRWFFVMELVRGREFLDFVRNRAESRREGSSRDSRQLLSVSRLRSCLAQLATGAAALHERGLVHRDLKPSNVLVEEGGRLVILDFGIVHAFGAEGGDELLAPAGTPIYMAPEQILGEGVGPKSDVYAMGVMLYEALTGRLPFVGEPAQLLIDKGMSQPPAPSSLATVPSDLEAVCLQMLSVDADARPTAIEVAERLGTPPSRRRVSRPGALVGRHDLLETLHHAYAATERGPQAVFVHGAPGIGKSSLMRVFIRQLEDRHDVTVFAGQCHERESVPYRGVDRVVDAISTYLGRLPRSEAAALMPRGVQHALQLFPVLGAVPATQDVPAREQPTGDPVVLRERAFSAVKELLARIADKTPLVLVIDDLQWSDVDSARLLSWVLAPPDCPRVLLALVHRDVDPASTSVVSKTRQALAIAGVGIQTIEVGPLSSGGAVELARRVLDHAADTSTAAAIATRAEGHPLFITELALEHLRRGGGRAIETAPGLVDVIWERVERCSYNARALLETVALAGCPLSPALCFEAAGLGGAGAEALRALRGDQLLHTTETGRLGVFHDRVRDAVQQRAERSRQAARHLSLARTLEREAVADSEAVARHYDAAGRPREAGDYAVRAARRAVDALAFERGAELYRFAIERLRDERAASGELHESLAHALSLAGATAEASSAYLEAARRAKSVADDWRVAKLERLGYEKATVAGDGDVGTAGLWRLLADVGESVPSRPAARKVALASALIRLRWRGTRFVSRSEADVGRAMLHRIDVMLTAARSFEYTDPVASVILAARVGRLAVDAGEPRRVAHGLVTAAPLLLAMRKRKPAVFDAYLEVAQQLGESLDDATIVTEVAIRRGQALMCYGHWESAKAAFAGVETLFEQRGISDGDALRYARAMAMQCAIFMGEFRRAYSAAGRLLMTAIERQDPVAEEYARAAVCADEKLNADDPEAARAVLACREQESRCITLLYRAEAEARIALYCNEPQDAVATWTRAWPVLEASGWLAVPFVRARAGFARAMAMIACGETGQRALRPYVRLVGAVDSAHGEAMARTVEGARRCASDRRGDAVTCFEEAAQDYERAAMAPLAAACRLRVAQILGNSDDIAAAAATLRRLGIARPGAWVDAWVPIKLDRPCPPLEPAP